MKVRCSLFALALTLGPLLPASGTAPAWKITPLAEAWKMPGFQEALDLSGIASLDGKHCLVGTDELFSVQPGTIDRAGRRIAAGAPVPLLTPTAAQRTKLELDIEGVAVAPAEKCYYVTGSHGVGKKKGDFQPARNEVFRVPVNAASGEIDAQGIRRTSLLPWLERSDEFSRYVGKPLQQNGVNVEGLAWADGKLWFGLRGPNVDGTGYVIEASTASLFSGGTIDGRVHRLPLGPGRGIREIAAVKGGFLILTGNSAAEASKKIPVSLAREADSVFELLFWQPDGGLTPIGRLPASPGKAEALLVLDDQPHRLDLLVIFDSAPDGGPLSLRLERR